MCRGTLGRKKQVKHNDVAFWNISLNTEILPKYFMKYFTVKKYRILYISKYRTSHSIRTSMKSQMYTRRDYVVSLELKTGNSELTPTKDKQTCTRNKTGLYPNITPTACIVQEIAVNSCMKRSSRRTSYRWRRRLAHNAPSSISCGNIGCQRLIGLSPFFFYHQLLP